MEIFHLRYFLAVAERLNFTRAAEDLHISASPLSRRIRDLERHLNATLFERTPREVRLTHAGRQLLPLARDVLYRFDNLAHAIQDMGAKEIHLGVSPSTPTSLVERVKAVLSSASSQPTISIELDNYATLRDRLARGYLDLTFDFSPVSEYPSEELDGYTLRTYSPGIIMRADDPLVGRRDLVLADFKDRRLVALSDDVMPPSYRRLIKQLMQMIEAEPVDPAPDLMRLAYAIAHEGRYNLTFSDFDAPADRVMRSFDLVTVPLRDVSDRCATSIVWSAPQAANPRMRAVVCALRLAFAPSDEAFSRQLTA